MEPLENLLLEIGWVDVEIFNTEISDAAWFYTLEQVVNNYNSKYGTEFESCETVHKYLRQRKEAE